MESIEMNRFLIILSLCCMACAIGATPTILIAATEAPTPTATTTQESYTCLVVIAYESLNLRKRATEHNSQVIDWLLHGEQISGLEKEGDWWRVDTGNKVGYVKAEFVEVCP